MSEKLKPVCCGCGGEAIILKADEYHQFPDTYYVSCTKCTAGVGPYDTEAETVKAWNTAMGTTEKSSTVERTAKVAEHDASVTDTDGYKYQRSEYLCGNCKKKVLGGDEYCSHCGCRLDWGEDIPMEYFESGGI